MQPMTLMTVVFVLEITHRAQIVREFHMEAPILIIVIFELEEPQEMLLVFRIAQVIGVDLKC